MLICYLFLAPCSFARPGVIEFSDGKSLEGNITLTPGKQIQFLDGSQQRAFGLDKVREIRFAPEEETMERAWRFPEAGKSQKEFTGQPYPIRHVKATVVLSDGGTIAGHLFTTVLYVEGKETTRKVVLYAKQRGEPGQTLGQLSYPSLIRFTDDAGPAVARLRVTMRLAGIGAQTDLLGLTLGSLVRLDGHPAGKPAEYDLAAPLGEELLLGCQTGNDILIGWPKTAAAKIVARIKEGITDAEDFFDGKELLGVWYDEPAGNVYSLMLLSRRGATTLGGDKTQPWRISIWRWKYDPETNQLMLAGRGDLFRGILGRGDALPTVRTSEKLWQPKIDGQTVVIHGD